MSCEENIQKRKLAVFFVFDSEIDVRVLVIRIFFKEWYVRMVLEQKKSVVNIAAIEARFECWRARG